MSITSYSQTRIGDATTVTVVSGLTGDIRYYWYVDGSYVGVSAVPRWTFHAAGQAEVICVDSIDPAFDPADSPPAGYPARRTIRWTSSPDAVMYLVEQRRESEAWATIGRVPEDGRWKYAVLTPVLDDLTTYAWRVSALDAAGNATITYITGHIVVRRPDAPAFTATFVPATTKVAFASA